MVIGPQAAASCDLRVYGHMSAHVLRMVKGAYMRARMCVAYGYMVVIIHLLSLLWYVRLHMVIEPQAGASRNLRGHGYIRAYISLVLKPNGPQAAASWDVCVFTYTQGRVSYLWTCLISCIHVNKNVHLRYTCFLHWTQEECNDCCFDLSMTQHNPPTYPSKPTPTKTYTPPHPQSHTLARTDTHTTHTVLACIRL